MELYSFYMSLKPIVDYYPCACAWQKHHIEAWKKWNGEKKNIDKKSDDNRGNQVNSEHHAESYLAHVPVEWRYKFCAETLAPCSPWFHYHIPETQKTLFTTKYLDLAFCHPSAMKTFVMQSKHRVQAHTQVLLQHTIMSEYKHQNWLVFPIAPRPIRAPFCQTSQCVSLEDAYAYTNERILVEWVTRTRYTGPPVASPVSGSATSAALPASVASTASSASASAPTINKSHA